MPEDILTEIHGRRLGLTKNDDLIIGGKTAMTLEGDQVQTADPKTAVGVGAAAGTGVTALEYGNGTIHKTVLTFANTPVPLVDNAGVVAHGGLKVYDFPAGAIMLLGSVADIALTKSSAGVNDDWDGDIGFGTVVADTGATLTGTEQNVIKSTSTPQAVDGVTTGDCTSLATVPTVLTDNSAGTADNTVQAMAAPTDSPATADALRDDISAVLLPAIRNNVADLAGKINEILAFLTGGKVLIADGTGTAVDLYVNLLVDDADHDVTSTPCNLIVNGTLTITWMNAGDI